MSEIQEATENESSLTSDMTFFLRGKQLISNTTLSQCGLKDGDTVFAIRTFSSTSVYIVLWNGDAGELVLTAHTVHEDWNLESLARQLLQHTNVVILNFGSR